MKNIKYKGIAGILSAVLIMVGAFLIVTSGNKVLASENVPNIDKFLNVKWQVSNEPYQLEGSEVKNLRIVTTIDAEKNVKYGQVGFEIKFLADNNDEEIPMNHNVSTVSHRISANSHGETYDYGPKSFHSTSEWLATCTIMGIPGNYWDNPIVIKPYVTIKGNTSHKYYGEPRYLTMQDIEQGIITLPVEGQLTNPTVSGVDSNKVDSEYYDGYTYMRVKVDDLSELPSISQYTVQHNDGTVDVKYRYLLAGAADCGNTVTDHSWYYESDGDNKVIVTPSEMRSFMVLSKTSTNGGSDKNFAGETIYLGADITLDKNTLWNSIGATNLSETYGKYFAGHFDGNMHTIAGVTVNKTTGRVYGLFGEVKGANAIVENFILSDSSFTISTEQTNTYSGCIVGSLNQGTVRNVKCDSTVKLTIGKSTNHYNGGLVGRAIKGVIENCWFAGRIEGSGTYQGGILGGLYNNGATCSIEQCLFTGNIKLNEYTGGICGDVRSDGAVVNTLTIRDTLYVGDMSGGDGKYYKGLFIGNVASSAQVVADNLYGHNTTFAPNVKNIGWADGTGANANRTIDAEVTHLERTAFNGATGYLNIDLDYYVPEDHEDGTWVIVDGVAPHLKVFGDVAGERYIDIREIGGETNDTRTVWYKATDDKEETFILYSPADFRGFQELSLTYDFAPGGVQDTVKLGADIDLNPGWRSSAPNETECIPWEPIGSSGMNSASTVPKFAGIFDGDMHSISGVYLTTSTTRIGLFGHIIGGKVQNLILRNSYLESTATTNGRLGSIVGHLNGIVDTVKAENDVYVVANGTKYVGGLVGVISEIASGTITNSWFDGWIKGTGEHRGGILGGVVNISAGDPPVGYISHCLVTGTIETCNNVGGICGVAWTTNSELTVSDSLFAGTFDEKTTTGNMGTVFGHTGNSKETKVENVFVRKVNSDLVTGYVGSGSSKITGDIDKLTQLDPEKLYFDEARTYTGLTIYPEGQDSSLDVDDKQFYWYVSDEYPVLASFGTPMTYSSLKVGTFNIKRASTFGDTEQARKDNMKAIAQFIVDNKLDVCILNEVDNNCERTNYMNQAEYIEQEVENLTGETYYSQFAAALDYNTETNTTSKLQMYLNNLTGQYGNAVISRYPIEQLTPSLIQIKDAQIVENGDSDYERRVILQTEIDVNGTKVTVIGTHFGLNEDERIAGIALLNTMVQNINTPIVFAGDLNMGVDDELFNTIDGKIVSTTKGRYASTIPVTTPTVQYDYIFRSDDFTSGYAVVQNPLGTGEYAEMYLSDHRPLVVNLYMNIK